LGLGNTTRATIDAYRLVIGTTSDTTTAGGILIGGDVEIYRSAANFLRIGDNLVVDLTSKLTQQTLIGTGSHSTNAFLTLNGTIPDASSALVGVDANMVGGLTHSGSGSSITGFLGRPSTANFGSSTVVTDMTDFYASQPVNGILSSVTNMTGFYVGDFLVSAATNKYGFKSLMTQGTNKWDLYLAGGASSYISGSVGIGNALQSTIESFRLLVGTPLDSTSNKGMSFGGDTTLYRYGVNSLKTDGDFNIGQAVYIGQFANFVSYGSSLFPPNPSGNNITIFTQQGITWQRESDGNTIALTNEQGNVYEEEVDVLGNTATPTTIYDSTGLVANANFVFSLTDRIASSFLNVNASTLTSMDLSFQRGGLTGGLAKVEIWSFDILTNKPLAYIGESTNSQNIGVIPTTFTPQLFNFVFSGVSLSAGTKYFMVAKVVGGSNPFNVLLSVNGAGNGVDWKSISTDSGATWTAAVHTQLPLLKVTGDVMVGPSGNNQMSPIVANPLGTILTLPKDKIYLLGNNLVARTVSAGSGEVRISKKNHTMSNGDIVTVAATNALDGITAGQMTGSFLVTVVDTDTISIATAGSATVGGVYGYVNRVSTIKIRYYLVGQKELELYLNGVLQRRGEHWDELGTSNTQSNTVKIYREFNIKDRVTWRIDSNGGQTMIGAGGGGGSGSLQSAYNSGSTISISPAAPVEISGSGTLMNIYGILNAYTTISKGHEFSTQVASPVASGKYGLWVDTAGVLYYHKDTVDIAIFSSSSENLTSSGLENGALTTMVFQTPVSYGSLGTLQRVDVSSEALSTATFGVVSSASIGVGSTGSVCTSGKMENVVGSFTFGDVIYVDKTGSLSNTKPSIGVGGFVSGDSIVRIGVILRNKTNPLLKDLIIGVQYVGKL
jgi:hypothetical protein